MAELPREHFHKIAKAAIDCLRRRYAFPAGADRMAGDIGWMAYNNALAAGTDPDKAVVDYMGEWLETYPRRRPLPSL